MTYLKWSDPNLQPVNLWSLATRPDLFTIPGKPIKVTSTTPVNKASNNEVKNTLYQAGSTN